MKTRDLVSKACILGTICIFSPILAGPASGASTGSGSSAVVESKLTAQFSDFAGSDDNAQSLVAGLRSGTPITLTTVPAPGQTASSLTFDPPTRPMGYGNVSISLALARQQLANVGITEPTPEELRAALVGGTVVTGSGATAQTVTLPGILTLRSAGEGWGAIARSQGMNLGQVMSAMKSGGRSAAVNSEVTANAASGAGLGAARAQGHAGFSGSTSGIVTAAGTSPGFQGNHYGNSPTIGIVRGDGSAARGNGLAKGRFK